MGSFSGLSLAKTIHDISREFQSEVIPTILDYNYIDLRENKEYREKNFIISRTRFTKPSYEIVLQGIWVISDVKIWPHQIPTYNTQTETVFNKGVRYTKCKITLEKGDPTLKNSKIVAKYSRQLNDEEIDKINKKIEIETTDHKDSIEVSIDNQNSYEIRNIFKTEDIIILHFITSLLKMINTDSGPIISKLSEKDKDEMFNIIISANMKNWKDDSEKLQAFSELTIKPIGQTREFNYYNMYSIMQDRNTVLRLEFLLDLIPAKRKYCYEIKKPKVK